nr:uncharacterized protein LOC103433235 isoform X1 [Malus domestica]
MSSDFQNCFELRKAPIFWAEAATVGKVRHKRLVREMRGCWWHNTCLIILSPSTSFPIKGSFGEGDGNAATVNKKLLNLQKLLLTPEQSKRSLPRCFKKYTARCVTRNFTPRVASSYTKQFTRNTTKRVRSVNSGFPPNSSSPLTLP